jgi:hypothetical protein
MASLYNMFQPLYWSSSGRTFSYFKANYTIYNVFVNETLYKVIHKSVKHFKNS